MLQELLPEVWTREATKQSIERISDAKFDLQYEQMCKEQGVTPAVSLPKPSLAQLQPKPCPLELKIELPKPPEPFVPEEISGPISPRNHTGVKRQALNVHQRRQRDDESYGKKNRNSRMPMQMADESEHGKGGYSQSQG